MQKTVRRALFIRIDRMGDLVLTLPTDQLARMANVDVDWWIPQGLSFITSRAVPPRSCIEVARKGGFRQWLRLFFFLKKRHYDVAIVFHAPWWVNFLLWVARIPLRFGNKSQWHSYLFLNRGLRQKRSQVRMHELDYNYELVAAAFSGSPETPHLRLEPPPTFDAAKRAKLPNPYVVIHPGMGGSALNWPASSYAQLITKLTHTFSVVITGTAGDAEYLAPLKEILKNSSRVHFFDGEFSGEELLWVLKGASGVVAPSTGVLHLAASLGVPTLGIFSPIKVESIRRWGPRGDQITAIEPQPTNEIGPEVMANIQPEAVYLKLLAVMKKSY